MQARLEEPAPTPPKELNERSRISIDSLYLMAFARAKAPLPRILFQWRSSVSMLTARSKNDATNVAPKSVILFFDALKSFSEVMRPDSLKDCSYSSSSSEMV